MFVGNQVFMRYLGTTGLARSIGCYYTLPFVFMVGNAIAQSAQPIISYNFGAGNLNRVARTGESRAHNRDGLWRYGDGGICGIPDLLVGLFRSGYCCSPYVAIAGFPYFATGFVFLSRTWPASGIIRVSNR